MNAPMRHAGQAMLVIAVVAAIYLLTGLTERLLARVVFGVDYEEGSVWRFPLLLLFWSILAGFVLMRALTWRWRWLAMLALPVLLLLVVPNVAYLRAREIIGHDISYLAMWPYYLNLSVPVLGMIVGGLLAARRR